MAAARRSSPPGVAPVPGAALEPPPGNPRFPLFDGLRALAAMSVLTFHVAYWSHMDIGTAGLSPYTARLNVGVTIFFLISGFLLYRPFLAGRTGDGPPVRLLDYARRRVVRIVPAYWVALTLFGLYPGLPDLFSSRWWVYYGFGQDYGKWTVLAGLDVAWTLGCEVFFYIVLPLFALSFAWLAGRLGRRLWWQFEVAVLGVLIAASTAFYVYAATHPRRISPAEPGATFSWFALGMLLAMASLWLERRGGKLLESLRRYAWTGWLVALVAYVVICRGLGLYSGPPFKELDSPLQTFAVYALDGVVAVGVALPAVFERRPQSAIGRALAWRPLAWLGLISYGVYLYHNVLLTTFAGHFQLGSSVTEKFLSMLVACAFLAILAGALSYYIVERPILRLKENPLVKLRIRRAPPPSPAVAQDPVAVTPFAPGSRSSMSAAPEPPGPS